MKKASFPLALIGFVLLLALLAVLVEAALLLLPATAVSPPPAGETPQPTYTARPSYTPQPTYTFQPTYTALPSYTPQPTYTPPAGGDASAGLARPVRTGGVNDWTTGFVVLAPDWRYLAHAYSRGDEVLLDIWDSSALLAGKVQLNERIKAMPLSPGKKGYFRGLAFLPGAMALATSIHCPTCSPNSRTEFWLLPEPGYDAGGRLLYMDVGGVPVTLNGDDGPVLSLLAAPDGRTLIAAHPAGIERFDLAALESTRLDARSGEVLACSPDGQFLASGGGRDAPNDVYLLDLVSGQTVRSLSGLDQPARALAYSPDGQSLAAAAGDSILVWDVRSGELRRRLAHLGALYALAFSPDGRILASGSERGALVLWDVEGGEALQRVVAGAGIYGLRFSPDGRLLYLNGLNGFELWRLP